MTQPTWQKLDPNNLPSACGVYAFLWRKQWLYLGRSVNLKQTLEGEPWPFKIAKSLDDAELLWMAVEDHGRMESKLKRVVRVKWQGVNNDIQQASQLHCELPSQIPFEPRPMLARSLAHA